MEALRSRWTELATPLGLAATVADAQSAISPASQAAVCKRQSDSGQVNAICKHLEQPLALKLLEPFGNEVPGLDKF
jgi:hypothetical protein